MLADEGSVEVANFVTPRALLVVIESEAIFVTLKTRLVAVPVGKSETLAGDPPPVSFLVPIASTDPKAFGFACAAISVAEERLRVQIGDGRQGSMVRLAHAFSRIPVHLFRMKFVIILAVSSVVSGRRC